MPIPDYCLPAVIDPSKPRGMRVFTEENRMALITHVMGEPDPTGEGNDILPVTIRMAAGLCGISWETVKSWMLQGSLELHQWECEAIEEVTPIAAFYRVLTILENKMKANLIQDMIRHAKLDRKGLTWPVFMTVLERVFPDEYGQTQRIQQTVQSTSETTHTIKIERTNRWQEVTKGKLPELESEEQAQTIETHFLEDE